MITSRAQTPAAYGYVVNSLHNRDLKVYIDGFETRDARVTSKTKDACVGDVVELVETAKDLLVEKILPRKNCLVRSYGSVERKIVSNLDHLYIVTAPGGLFNHHFINRALAVAQRDRIPVSLIFNKNDLGLYELEEYISLYSQLDITVLRLSAKTDPHLDPLRTLLDNPTWRIVAFCGVSGVGKSTILNNLIPGAKQKVQTTSLRTGQGRQTTSGATAYPLLRINHPTLLLVDLPGIQQFGVAHLSRDEIKQAFTEFRRFEMECQFQDCGHDREDQCGVKAALQRGEIHTTRYTSYLEMLEEAYKHDWARKTKRGRRR